MTDHKWLLFFSSLPAKPVAARMKIWRRLGKSGALHLKGSVYLLPHSEERQELLTWLAQEIESLGGEADYVVVERTAAMNQAALTQAYNQARTQAYRALEPELEALERRLAAPSAQADAPDYKKLAGQLRRLKDQHSELAKADFFKLAAGAALAKRLSTLEDRLAARRQQPLGLAGRPARPAVAAQRRQDYQGRLWITRPRPFVDRMASAWLIRRFIDPAARFAFQPEGRPLPAQAVAFDMQGGQFSHLGDWCSFEVLIKAFGLKDKALASLARIVHELDLHDGKFSAPQARGTEEILRGVLRTARDDQEVLDKAMTVFDLLYASLT